jgi:DNA-binding transcriptional ArsR family regulator
MDELLLIAAALSDPNRVRALLFLRDGELCVCQIIEMLGLAPSTVSKHMSLLLAAGLVKKRKAGRWNYYARVAEGAAPVLTAIAWVDTSLDRDAGALADRRRLKRLRLIPIRKLSVCYQS